MPPSKSKEEIIAELYPDFSGPNSKEMRRLYDELSNLAGKWRKTQHTDGKNSPIHLEIAQEYNEKFQQLADLGWDWLKEIDTESMLPDALMPDVYYQTLSPENLMDELLTRVRWWLQKTYQKDLSIYSFDKAYKQLLDSGIDPETTLPRRNEKASSVIWSGIPLSPEGFYERNPEYREKKRETR